MLGALGVFAAFLWAGRIPLPLPGRHPFLVPTALGTAKVGFEASAGSSGPASGRACGAGRVAEVCSLAVGSVSFIGATRLSIRFVMVRVVSKPGIGMIVIAELSAARETTIGL